MKGQGKERGILKLDARPRVSVVVDTRTRAELTPQGSWERTPSSPQPSVDRLSVTFAEPDGSMASSGVNLFHVPSETPITNEIKFSPSPGDGSDDEDYSASLSAVLRQRRASVRRSRKGKTRRPSSPFIPDELRARRRSSVFTTSSGDTAISMEEGLPAVVTQEQIFENIHLHKEVLGSVKQQPLGMRRKLKIMRQAKAYIKKHEGQLQERLAQSKSTRDIYARFNILMTAKWHQLKREAANMSNVLIPWELRIKEIESHFGSVVASYFTFLRWLFWVNLVIAFILMVFVIVPEYLTANPDEDGERKKILEEDSWNSTKLLTLLEFEGVMKCSPIFYGYYTNIERGDYRMPLAYFLTGLVVYIYSFVATLRKMAENSRMSKLSEKEDECIFSWKLFTGWDYMIGNAETAHNRIASVILGFKEALLEEAEKKKDLRNWRIISFRALVNICVVLLLAVSAYAVVTVVSRSHESPKTHSWWREIETTLVVSLISISFPIFFELLGLLEHYHPRNQLRLQLARIMLLNLLNLYSFIFALFSKIEGMSKELDSLQPTLNMNASMISETTLNITESLMASIPTACTEVRVPCSSYDVCLTYPNDDINNNMLTTTLTPFYIQTPVYHATNTTHTPYEKDYDVNQTQILSPKLEVQNIVKKSEYEIMTVDYVERYNLHGIISQLFNETDIDDISSETDEYGGNYTYENVNETNEFDSNEDLYSTEQEKNTISTDSTTVSTENDTQWTEETSTDMTTVNDDVGDYYNSSEFWTTYTNTLPEADSSMTSYTENDNVRNSSVFVNDGGSNSSKITWQVNEIEETTPYGTTNYSSLTNTPQVEILSTIYSPTTTTATTITKAINPIICPQISLNCTIFCGGNNVTQVYLISNCTLVEKRCYIKKCEAQVIPKNFSVVNKTNETSMDVAYIDSNNRKQYNLTTATKRKLSKLCWETMFGQELVKLTMMDLVVVVMGTLITDFFRALLVRHMNRCWCWDLEKNFPSYGDFKIAENILHLINNQGMVWMGMFFSPGLAVINVFKLVIIMYLRSWAVMTSNVPHKVVFRVSKSNNFYLALLLTMLFLCVLPVGYSIVWVKPSWHCGPFSEHKKIYHILTNNIYKILPRSLNFSLEYIASPAMIIPLLVLLILIIYYLTSLTNSLREANNDLKIQLRRERTEERRKMFQLADTRRRAGSSALDNTPFTRWKKALPSLPLGKSIDSDDRKTMSREDTEVPLKKKKGGIFAKIVSMALDKKCNIEGVSETENPTPSPSANIDDETDTEFHEALPKEVLKVKQIYIQRDHDEKTEIEDSVTPLGVQSKASKDLNKQDSTSTKKDNIVGTKKAPSKHRSAESEESSQKEEKNLNRQRTSESSTQSKQSDSISSVIPVITISTTESDDDLLGKDKMELNQKNNTSYSDIQTKNEEMPLVTKKTKNSSTESRSLRRQSSVDSIKDNKQLKEKPSEGHKYQYSL